LSKPNWSIFGLAFAIMLSASGPTAGEPTTVLELFTSQGCSSCPPADKLIGELAERDDVLALSFNVDYWDYLGWKDTLATSDNSDRQRAYAAAREDHQVYTPQIVVNGHAHVVGSNKRAVEAAIKDDGGLPVTIDLLEKSDAITVSIDQASDIVGATTLWVVFYESMVSVPITRGENTGKTIAYSNVVRKIRPIAMWDGGAMSVDLPKSEMANANVKRCAVLLQTETEAGLPGRVLGAAMLDHDLH
jgi:hypothetical protein